MGHVGWVGGTLGDSNPVITEGSNKQQSPKQPRPGAFCSIPSKLCVFIMVGEVGPPISAGPILKQILGLTMGSPEPGIAERIILIVGSAPTDTILSMPNRAPGISRVI